jgi:hypothetical protein
MHWHARGGRGRMKASQHKQMDNRSNWTGRKKKKKKLKNERKKQEELPPHPQFFFFFSKPVYDQISLMAFRIC